MLIDIDKVQKNKRLSQAMIGMSKVEFESILPTFESLLLEEKKAKKRRRAVGAGQKGLLKSAKNKLFFILFYLKTYPTFDVAGAIFGTIRSVTHEWFHKFLPILEKTLGRQMVLPKRKLKSKEEFIELFGVEDIFVDGAERPVQRPKSKKKTKKQYSGKKKRHTRKNTVICNKKRQILCVSPTHDGRIHDKTQLEKSEFLNNIPDEVPKWLDKAFQGIQKYTRNVFIPHKKPKKKSLSDDKKEENQIISSYRIKVEHAICGIKRLRCLTDVFRGKNGIDDTLFRVACGIWNLHLSLA
jgi:hypothetical protein